MIYFFCPQAWYNSKSLDHAYVSKSYLVQVVRFLKMLCHDVNSFNVLNSGSRHEF